MFPAGPVRPTGFGVDGLSVMIVGANALPRTQPPGPPRRPRLPAASGGRVECPEGNSRTTKTHSPRPSSQIQPSQLTRVTARGKWARSRQKPPVAYARPVADSSQPIGFRGRFHASSAPTVAKAVMNATAITPSDGLPPWLRRLAGSGFAAV